MVKVSAIVSAYYAENFLKGRIENLLAQSLKPEIVIVCELGSPEDEIANDFADVKIIHTDGIPTLYEAWNMAIKEAQGEYITTANCDDRFYPRAIEKLAKALDENKGFAMAYHDIDVVEEIDGKPIRTFNWYEGGLKELVYQGCFLGPMPMWRKSLHDKYGYFLEVETLKNGDQYKYEIVSDYEFWMRLAAGNEKFYHIKEVLGAYTSHGENLEHKHPLRRMWEDARVKSKYSKRFEVIP